ncbi:pyridoxal 5'-phosphate synthase glutaminase subunit PdxT [soil metagenome]|jgi:5'-phosphate synthase pdxT subunit|nr:pyridoxal 5'-phosphate synthase glutaminase subunit PdxT [Euzebyaceae bacterium]
MSHRVPGEPLVGRRAADPPGAGPVVGVLALQGDVLEHLRILRAVGARAVAVKRPEELGALDGLVIPGGESTTIGKLAEMYGLMHPLRGLLADGLPAFGTCAGAILLGRVALGNDGQPSGQPLLGVMDTVVRRNAFGRQVDSFEADLDIPGVDGGPLHAVFIRAPWIEETGPDVEVLATVDPPDREGRPTGDKVVLARQGRILASAFHPELTGDDRLHRLFVEAIIEGEV